MAVSLGNCVSKPLSWSSPGNDFEVMRLSIDGERKSMKEFNRQASAAVNLSFSFRTFPFVPEEEMKLEG